MAAPTNMITTLTAVGQREDLEDVIYRVAPEETPLISAIGKVKATARFHEWQTEDLAAANGENAALEGNDVSTTLDAPNLTTRVGNYCQIFTKNFGVTRTAEVVDKAGRASETARQSVMKGIEIRRDMEKAFIGNRASQNESGANPRKTGGLLAWLTTNVSRGATGANGGFSAGIVAAASPGTLRTFTEAQVKAVLNTAFNSGASQGTRLAFMGATNKQEFSAFTGIAAVRKDVPGRDLAVLVAGAEYYVSDFGELLLMPHAYGLTRDLLVVDPKMAAVATLDGFKKSPLGKSGDGERFLLTHEAALVCRNEKAHANVADIQ